VADPRLTLELRGGSGALLYRTATPVELDAGGAATIAFEISDLALLGGDYDLSLGAADGRHEPELERTVRFSVAREPGPEGIVDLRGEWRALATAPGRPR
jgi:hypothetical protein